ncbi:hypothetical protein EBR66_08210 [bacterium]|nr:hypothetical protein [bacterium]
MNPQLLIDMMNEDFAMQVAKEFGIENEPLEVRAALIEALGSNITRRFLLEVLKELPEEKRDGFADLVGTDKLDDMYEIVSPYIPDLDAFVKECAQREIQETKKLIVANT